MIKFLSTTFGHVTHLNISKCNLVSNAAEVNSNSNTEYIVMLL